MVVDPEELSPQALYKVLVGSVVPRPIGWISTISTGRISNLAPFSFFTVASCSPPMVAFTIIPRDQSLAEDAKDTQINIECTREFVVNVVDATLGNAMALTGLPYPPGTSEFEEAGLTESVSDRVSAPRVGEAAISMECVLEKTLQMGSATMIVGRVVSMHVRDDLLLTSGRIDIAGLRPLGRVGGQYAVVADVFDLPSDVGSRRLYVTIPDGSDLTGRVAARLVHTAQAYSSLVWVSSDGREMDCKSLREVLSLGAGGGRRLGLRAQGTDSASALRALALSVAAVDG